MTLEYGSADNYERGCAAAAEGPRPVVLRIRPGRIGAHHVITASRGAADPPDAAEHVGTRGGPALSRAPRKYSMPRRGLSRRVLHGGHGPQRDAGSPRP